MRFSQLLPHCGNHKVTAFCGLLRDPRIAIGTDICLDCMSLATCMLAIDGEND
jgi:hypothetical protein